MQDQELLSLCNELLSYNPETGLFTHRISHGRARAGQAVGSNHSEGYTEIRVKGNLRLCHRLAFLMTYGYLPKYIDHINQNRKDNRIINLRECTASQNQMNAPKRGNPASGYKGVGAHGKRWVTRIRIDGKKKHIGVFDSKIEAAKAYNEAALKHHGEFAYLNDIP